MEKPCRLQSMGSHRVGHDCSDLAAAAVEYCNLLCPFYISTTLTASLCRRTEFKASLFHFKDPGWFGPSGFSQLLHVGSRTSLKLWFVKDICHWGLLRKGHNGWLVKLHLLLLLVTQSCLTLCDPMDCSLPGFSVHGILQPRILEWVAISFPRSNFILWTLFLPR